MVIIKDQIYLDYSDVLLMPKRSSLESRSQVSLERTFSFLHSKRTWSGVPIIAANMDTTGTFEMFAALSKHKMITALHKHYNTDDLYDFYINAVTPETADYIFYSMGMSESDFQRLRNLVLRLEARPDGNNVLYQINIDVPNGYIEKFATFVSEVRKEFPGFTISAGNVCTHDMVEQLILSGADIVKVGIGSGASCITRKKTGIGMPQLSAVLESADAAHGLGGMIIGDGGITCEGDFAKGFCAGADFLMVGSFFAGHAENGGEIITRDGEYYMEFYGMSSQKANIAYSGGLKEYRASEGRELIIPYKGSIINTVQEILGGLRSTGTYIGAKKLKNFSKCATFMRVNNILNRSLEKYEA